MLTKPELKKKTGRPRIESEQVKSRVRQPLLGKLDAYAAGAGIDRAEAIRRLLEKALAVERRP